LQTIIIVTL